MLTAQTASKANPLKRWIMSSYVLPSWFFTWSVLEWLHSKYRENIWKWPIFIMIFPFYSQVVKMQNMVTYPLYNLDLGEHVPFKDPDTCYSYDLYGVVVSLNLQTLESFYLPCEFKTKLSCSFISKYLASIASQEEYLNIPKFIFFNFLPNCRVYTMPSITGYLFYVRITSGPWVEVTTRRQLRTSELKSGSTTMTRQLRATQSQKL